MTEAVWNFIERCFRADFTLRRPISKMNSFRSTYSVQHDEHLKVRVLPPVDQITKQELEDMGKPVKIYYGAETTFA